VVTKEKMMIRYLLAPMLVASIGTALAASGGSPNGKPFVEINGQIAEVKGLIATMEQRMESLLSRVAANELRIDGVDDAVAWLQNQNSELIQTMSDLDSGLTTIQESVAALEADSSNLRAELESYGDYLNELESKIANNQEMIDLLNLSLVEGLNVIEERLAENELMMLELSALAEDIQGQLALKQNLISGTCFEDERLVSIEEDGSLICVKEGENPLGELRVVEVSKIIEIDTSTWRYVYEGYSHKLACHNRVGGQFEVPSSLKIKSYPASGTYNYTNPQISFSGDSMNVNVVYEDYLFRKKPKSYFVKLTVFCLSLEGQQGELIRTD